VPIDPVAMYPTGYLCGPASKLSSNVRLFARSSRGKKFHLDQ